MGTRPSPSLDFFPTPSSFWMEKAAGRGEDGPVILALNKAEGMIAIGVFDGLGGSGSRLLRRDDGSEVSAARMASEIAAKTTLNTLKDYGFEAANQAWPMLNLDSIFRSSLAWSHSSAFAAELQRRLEIELSEAASKLDVDRSAMRGSILKRLPTTLCVLIARHQQQGIALSAIWAGDSRAYVWSPRRGLSQLTRDHTKQPVDALDAIREDTPMSNFITPDLPFRLDLNERVVDEPCLFFCSTDGGFQFFPSPLEFELALIECLASTPKWADAVDALGDRIAAVTKDDVALGITGAGWRSQEELQAYLRRHMNSRLKSALDQTERTRRRLDQAVKNLRDAESVVTVLSAELDEVRRIAWDQYRIDYEALLPPFLSNDKKGAGQQ